MNMKAHSDITLVGSWLCVARHQSTACMVAQMRELTRQYRGQTGSSVAHYSLLRTHISYAHLYFDSENENGKDNVTLRCSVGAVHSRIDICRFQAIS